MPNAFAHVELSTDDLKKAKKFYQAVFAWTLTDVPNMPYTMIGVGEGVGGGMQVKQMPEQPNAWMPYVEVDDVKKTIAKASKAGARVVLDYQSIGDMGAIGVFLDPSGAALGVWEAGPAAVAAKASAQTAAKPAAKPARSAAPKVSDKATTKAPPAKASNKAATKASPAKASIQAAARAAKALVKAAAKAIAVKASVKAAAKAPVARAPAKAPVAKASAKTAAKAPAAKASVKKASAGKTSSKKP